MRLIQQKRSIGRSKWQSFYLLCLSLLILITPTSGQSSLSQKLDIDKKTEKSNDFLTKSEGLLLGSPPTYIDFNGFNGLELKISRPRTSLYDYTLMFWVRSVSSFEDLKVDPTIKNIKSYLFKLENSVGCYISREEAEDSTVTKEPYILCETGNGSTTNDIEIMLADLPDVQSWMHFTYSAIYKPASTLSGIRSESYLRIDISTFHIIRTGGYKPIKSSNLYYGAGGAAEEDVGFKGHYRQFYITVGYIDNEDVQNLMHEYKVLDYSTMAYYRFEQTIFIDRYDDSFRVQQARPLRQLPEFVQENISSPFCNSIPAA